MPKKAVLAFSFLALTACLLSYRLGSSPAALAKSPTPGQESSAPPPLSAPPAEWAITGANTGSTTPASAVKAGAAGVQHVADCIAASGYITGSDPVPFPTQVLLLDGTVVLMRWEIVLPSYTAGYFQVGLCGLSVVGTTGNSMTLEFFSAQDTATSVSLETVNLIGHDAT